ncbi:MAG: hypothetical protein ACXVW5_26650 [Solirubrobacteraceae bacterium]
MRRVLARVDVLATPEACENLWTAAADPAGQRHDAAVTLRDLAQIEWLPQGRLEAVDLSQAGAGESDHRGS